MKYEMWENFVSRVKDEVLPLLPENVEGVEITTILKNNGVSLTGLIIKNSSNIAPTIYLNSYYQQYLSGRPFEAILSDIALTYEKNAFQKDFDAGSLLKWENAKARIIRKLINYEQNKEMLVDMPFKKVEDLAIIYQICVDGYVNDDSYATIAVKNNFMEAWDKSVDEVDAVACKNTRMIHKASLENIGAIIDEAGGVSIPFLDELELYVLTNDVKVNGAIHVLDEEVMQHAAETLNIDRFFVIPSSVHEVLLLPYDENKDYEELEEMICEVNSSCLSQEEILSDKAYVVDVPGNKFMLAANYVSHLREKELMDKVKATEEIPHVKPKL